MAGCLTGWLAGGGARGHSWAGITVLKEAFQRVFTWTSASTRCEHDTSRHHLPATPAPLSRCDVAAREAGGALLPWWSCKGVREDGEGGKRGCFYLGLRQIYMTDGDKIIEKE